jgi:hypothetical protein
MFPLFIIVFGTRWHFKAPRGGFRGVLDCPDCGRPRNMVEKHAFKAFTLYWWPVWRLEDGGHVVECEVCEGHFELPKELRAGRS